MPINPRDTEMFSAGYRQAELDYMAEIARGTVYIDNDADNAPPTKWEVRITFESGRVMTVRVTSVEKPHYSGKTNWWQIKPETQVNMSKVESVTVSKR